MVVVLGRKRTMEARAFMHLLNAEQAYKDLSVFEYETGDKLILFKVYPYTKALETFKEREF